MLRAVVGASNTAWTKADLLLTGNRLVSVLKIGELSAVNRSTREIFLNVSTPKMSLVVMQAGTEKIVSNSNIRER